jgi:hypothetical protein
MKRLVNEFRDYARLPAADTQAAWTSMASWPTCCACTASEDHAGARGRRPGARVCRR